ncbi:hypothetical protein OIU78_000643, partial [Salix suchowensis]
MCSTTQINIKISCYQPLKESPRARPSGQPRKINMPYIYTYVCKII